MILEVTYAAVVWWGRIEITQLEVHRLQRAAYIMVIGAMRTTSTEVMEMLLDMPNLNTVVEVATLNCNIPPTETRSKGPGNEARHNQEKNRKGGQ